MGVRRGGGWGAYRGEEYSTATRPEDLGRAVGGMSKGNENMKRASPQPQLLLCF